MPGHIIDYILVKRCCRSSILNTWVYWSVFHESDHELVVMKIVRHAGVDSRMILFERLSSPMSHFAHHRPRQHTAICCYMPYTAVCLTKPVIGKCCIEVMIEVTNHSLACLIIQKESFYYELVVCTLRVKIKNKHRQSTVPHCQTTNLRADIKSDFRTHPSYAFSCIPNDTSIESSWSAFKSTINAACAMLPEVLSSHDPDWVTDELRNLSQKKSNAWLSYRDAAKRGYEVKSHREEYKLFAN